MSAPETLHFATRLLGCRALDEDLSQMEDGDRTKIGNAGAVQVSGGQMHRIALARAIYAQRRIYLLDDVLAGLDNRTQNVICHRLFSHTGILKRLGAAAVGGRVLRDRGAVERRRRPHRAVKRSHGQGFALP